MLQDVGVSEVRVELVRIEKFGNVQRDHTADRVVLEPEGSLPAGQMREWSFRMNVGKVSRANPEDGQVLGQVVGEGSAVEKDAARPASRAGD